MADHVTFIDGGIEQSNRVLAAWLNAVNNLTYQGKNPAYVTATGAAGAYTITLPASTLAALTDGQTLVFKANHTNTGAATLTVVGAVSIGPTAIKAAGAALAADAILSDAVIIVTYFGSAWNIMGVSTGPLFLQAGTGAVTRTVQNKLRDIICVRDFGATGDGTTDDLAAIQAAITYVSSIGGILSFPAGTYKVSAALTMTSSNVAIIGSGNSTVIAPSSVSADVFLIGNNSNDISGLIFRDFVIWPSVTKNAGYGFNCRMCSDSYWENVRCGSIDKYVANGDAHRMWNGYYFDRFAQDVIVGGEVVVANDGIKARGNSDQSFGAELSLGDGLFIYKTGGKGIWLGGATGGVYVNRVSISECRYGIYLDDTLQSGVYNRELFIDYDCAIDNCTGWGIDIRSNGLAILEANGPWISGCGSVGTGEGGILVATTTGVAVSADWGGIRLQSCYYDGMQLASGIHNITGGFVRSNGTGALGGHGVILADASVAGFSMANCVVHSNGDGTRGYGLENSAGVDNLVVAFNRFFSNGQGAATGTFIGGNRIWDGNLGSETGAQQACIAYTPTVTSSVGTLTTVGTTTGRYQRMGNRVYFFEIDTTITTNGTGSATIRATLPNSLTAATNHVVAGREMTVGKMLQGWIPAAGTYVSITNYDNTYPAADGYRIILSGEFEATT